MTNYQRNALGKGLSSLMPSSSGFEENRILESRELDIDSILANENQPRKSFDQTKLHELSDSIKEHGILQPLLVTQQGNSYRLIAGERRLRAARIAGLKMVPVIVKVVDDSKLLSIAIIENIQRQNLGPLEEAEAYKQLMTEYGYTQEELSQKLSKSRSYIANFLRLLNLPEAVQKLLADKHLSVGHAKMLLNVEDPSAVAEKMVLEKMSVRQGEEYIRQLQNKDKQQRNRPEVGSGKVNEGTKRVSHYAKLHANNRDDYSLSKDQDIIDIEASLSQCLNTKVQIVERSFGGQIVIDFYNLDQLDAIISQLAVKKQWF